MFLMKNKRSSVDGSQKIEDIRAKHKSPTETVAPVECVFCGEKEVFVNRNSLRNYTKQGNVTQVFICDIWSL